jgi:integration host factor alpha subunit
MLNGSTELHLGARMTKANLIDKLAERTQHSKKDLEHLLEAVLTEIAHALEGGEKVDLRGFGNFQAAQKKERLGRNPKTGETMTIAAKRVAVFKPSKELSERVNAANAKAPATEAVPS